MLVINIVVKFPYRLINAIDPLFHSIPFLNAKLCFGVLHQLRADGMSYNNPCGSKQLPDLYLARSNRFKFSVYKEGSLLICSVR